MTDHQPMPVAGYTSQSDDIIKTVNENKQLVDVVSELRAVKAEWVENPVASILSEANE